MVHSINKIRKEQKASDNVNQIAITNQYFVEGPNIAKKHVGSNHNHKCNSVTKFVICYLLQCAYDKL